MHDNNFDTNHELNEAELLLSDLVDNSAAVLVRDAGLDKEKADQVARKLAQAVIERWGGQQIYFSRGLLIQLSGRDLEIYNKYDGTPSSIKKLAHEYKISTPWVYAIVKAVGKDERAKRQSDLFPESMS